MKTLQKLIAPIALAASIAAAPAQAQDWRTADVFRTTSGQNYLRLEGASGKMNFGFLDLTKQGYFGQAQASQPVGKGFTVGAEYEGIGGAPDSFRPQLGFNTRLGPAVVELRYAPMHLMGADKQQASLFALIPLPNIGGTLSTWADHDWKDDGSTFAIGELQYSRPVHKGLEAAAIASWNKFSSPSYSFGVRKSF